MSMKLYFILPWPPISPLSIIMTIELDKINSTRSLTLNILMILGPKTLTCSTWYPTFSNCYARDSYIMENVISAVDSQILIKMIVYSWFDLKQRINKRKEKKH